MSLPFAGCLSVVGLLSVVALAQVQLPDAPGKDETVRICGTCHEAERAASVRLNREGWQDTIAKMVDLGAKASDEELAKVLDYLAEHFKGEAPRPLNLNTATAIELESIVGLLRKESAAWIAHRKTSGRASRWMISRRSRVCPSRRSTNVAIDSCVSE